MYDPNCTHPLREVIKVFELSKNKTIIMFYIYSDDTVDIVTGLNQPRTKQVGISVARHRFAELTIEGGYTWRQYVNPQPSESEEAE